MEDVRLPLWDLGKVRRQVYIGPLHLENTNFLNDLSNDRKLDLNPPPSKQIYPHDTCEKKNWICMTPECLKNMIKSSYLLLWSNLNVRTIKNWNHISEHLNSSSSKRVLLLLFHKIYKNIFISHVLCR